MKRTDIKKLPKLRVTKNYNPVPKKQHKSVPTVSITLDEYNQLKRIRDAVLANPDGAKRK